MIMAIVQNMDADAVTDALVKAGHRVTRVATTGGFFRQGNTTFLTGVDDTQVESVISIVRQYCQTRKRLRPVQPDPTGPVPVVGGYVEVDVGGANVFVFDVERHEHL